MLPIMNKNIVISTRTILITLTTLAALWLLSQVQAIILALFVSLIFALALNPFVNWLTRRRLPRGVAVGIIYFVLFLFLVTIGAALISPLLSQLQKLLSQLPAFIDSLIKFFGVNGYFRGINEEISRQLTGSSVRLVSFTLSAFSSLVLIVTVVAFTAYILLYFEKLKGQLLEAFPGKYQTKAKKVISEIEDKVGYWLRGELVLMLVVGLMTFVGLLLLGVDYALPLALISGFLEIVPNIGPITAAIPAAIVGFSVSPVAGLGVVALYILVQQLENNLIVPKVMQKAVGFNPLVTMVVILAGARLYGVLGALLAVPVTLMAVAVIKGVMDLEE